MNGDVCVCMYVCVCVCVCVQILTGGRTPFYWMPTGVCSQRRQRAVGTKFLVSTVNATGAGASVVEYSGLQGLSTVEAAAADGVSVTWSVNTGGRPRSDALLEQLVSVSSLSSSLQGHDNAWEFQWLRVSCDDTCK